MAAEPSLWSFISNAGLVVKTVMLILLCASVTSWTIIIQRALLYKNSRLDAKQFNNRFWSGIDLQDLFAELAHKAANLTGLSYIFHAGLNEFKRLKQQPNMKPDAVMEGSERAMRVATSQEIEKLEKHLSFLATVGSTSPYIGLFGTVWGIMTAFQALGDVQQATIAMVAPGISEALIATAMGLFAAIPAVIAYNRFNNDLTRLTYQYDNFQDELSGILHREAYANECSAE